MDKQIWFFTYNGKEYEIELEVDERWIVQQLGRRAVKSEGQRAVALAGAVVVRVK